MGQLKGKDLKKWVEAGEPIAGKSDGGGLTFTFSRGGTASWVFRYRHATRQRELTLGNYPDMSLEAARKDARAMRVLVDQGIDVAAQKRRERAQSAVASSFRAIAENYLERGAKDLAELTRRETRRYLDKDLLPRLGHRTARDIQPEDVVTVIERIGARSDSVARHSFELLSVIFAHALAKRAVIVNPCAGLRLSAILGTRPDRRPRKKLSRDELRAVFGALPKLGRIHELTVKILLATGVRKSELIKAKKSHVNLPAGAWTVPDENAKGGRGYVVPLAPAVVEWFKELLALGGDSQWVLPKMSRRGRIEDKHMSDKTLNAALYRLGVGISFSPHDLRSTARSHLAALGVDIIVAERCLNHSLGGLVAVYDQHDYLAERRRALELWAKLLQDLAGAQKVVTLRAAA